MSARQPPDRELLWREFQAGFASAFDFGGWLEDGPDLDESRAEFRSDAEQLAEDCRKVTGDLWEAERREHGQG
jgi:hypothetical protein